MEPFTANRATSAPLGRRRTSRRLPVWCDCGEVWRSDAPPLKPLGTVFRLVEQFQYAGEFIGVRLDERYDLQAACDEDGAESFHVELLDTAMLEYDWAKMTRAQLGEAFRAAYEGRDIRTALQHAELVWRHEQLGRSFVA